MRRTAPLTAGQNSGREGGKERRGPWTRPVDTAMNWDQGTPLDAAAYRVSAQPQETKLGGRDQSVLAGGDLGDAGILLTALPEHAAHRDQTPGRRLHAQSMPEWPDAPLHPTNVTDAPMTTEVGNVHP